MTRMASVGAGGEMGVRIIGNPRRGGHEVRRVKVGEAGRAAIEEAGAHLFRPGWRHVFAAVRQRTLDITQPRGH